MHVYYPNKIQYQHNNLFMGVCVCVCACFYCPDWPEGVEVECHKSG